MHCIVAGVSGGVEEIRRRMLLVRHADGRQGAPPRRRARPPSSPSPATAHPGSGTWPPRFPEVTRADLAELEVDQMRQLTNAHFADEHNR
jgi:hypothetical protein